jgi:hypothetical protein
MTGLLNHRQTLQKKLKNRQRTKNNLNFNATAHCTHLPLPAHTQINAKAKSKECNFPTLCLHSWNERFTEQNKDIFIKTLDR